MGATSLIPMKTAIDLLLERRAQEEERLRRMRLVARDMIEAGFKALASKLHADKGGLSEQMVSLKEVRDIMHETATAYGAQSTENAQKLTQGRGKGGRTFRSLKRGLGDYNARHSAL